MRVCDPEWVMRTSAHAVWSRRRTIFYVVSAASLAGNFIVLAWSLEVWGALAACGLLFYDLLPQFCELLMHIPLLYILLNLILVMIVVKSGVLGRLPKPEDSVDNNYHWPATFDVAAAATITVRESPVPTTSTALVVTCTEPASVICSLMAPNSPLVPQGAASFASLDIVFHDLKDDQKKEKCIEQGVASIKEPKAAQLPADSTTVWQPKRASLFTIEPLEMFTDQPKRASLFTFEPLEMFTDQPHGETPLQVGGGEVEVSDQLDTSPDHDANTVQDAVPVPLRKVGTRAVMLHDQLVSMEKPCGRPHDDENESLQLAKTYDSDDNELSRQEFNQRVDTFICQFNRNLTMQRQDSLSRLLGLVGGGKLRLIK